MCNKQVLSFFVLVWLFFICTWIVCLRFVIDVRMSVWFWAGAKMEPKSDHRVSAYRLFCLNSSFFLSFSFSYFCFSYSVWISLCITFLFFTRSESNIMDTPQIVSIVLYKQAIHIIKKSKTNRMNSKKREKKILTLK